MPNQKESFVHRSGRVGRAGTSGTNIILADNHREELIRLNDILRAVGISEKVCWNFLLVVVSRTRNYSSPKAFQMCSA